MVSLIVHLGVDDTILPCLTPRDLARKAFESRRRRERQGTPITSRWLLLDVVECDSTHFLAFGHFMAKVLYAVAPNANLLRSLWIAMYANLSSKWRRRAMQTRHKLDFVAALMSGISFTCLANSWFTAFLLL